MKPFKLREQSTEELMQLLVDSQKELREMRIKRGIGSGAQQPLRMRTLRRTVARMNTILTERETNNHG